MFVIGFAIQVTRQHNKPREMYKFYSFQQKQINIIILAQFNEENTPVN
jgi:hypothetical protein